MLAELREDNKELAARLHEAHNVCEEHRDIARASLIEVWIDETERRTWFLFEASRCGDATGHEAERHHWPPDRLRSRRMDRKEPGAIRITVTENGPYAVTGGPPLSRQAIGTNAAGESVEWVAGESIPVRESCFLCRCGQSSTKPFCDGTHAKVGFDGTETASRQPYVAQAQEIDGPALALTDAERLCAFGRFCDRDGGVWNTVSLARSKAGRRTFAHQVGQCPSGRLVAWDIASREPIEPAFAPSIVLVEDPAQGVSGPLWVRGGIEIVGADGVAYETRNRVTLCRCGQSSNKPFCDGTHATVGFSDE